MLLTSRFWKYSAFTEIDSCTKKQTFLQAMFFRVYYSVSEAEQPFFIIFLSETISIVFHSVF